MFDNIAGKDSHSWSDFLYKSMSVSSVLVTAAKVLLKLH